MDLKKFLEELLNPKHEYSDVKFRVDGTVWFMESAKVYCRLIEEVTDGSGFSQVLRFCIDLCPNKAKAEQWLNSKINTFDDGFSLGDTRLRLSLSRTTLRGEEFTLRILRPSIPKPPELLIPKSIVERNRALSDGITLIVGTTGSGKSTTVASLVQDRVDHRSGGGSVTTFEDPIEYVYAERENVWFAQYQLEVDFSDFISGVSDITTRNRTQDLVVQEIRRQESGRSMIPTLVDASQAGRYVMATHHAEDVCRCIDRLHNELAETGNMASWDGLTKQIRMIIAERLIFSEIHKRYFAIFEVLHSFPKDGDNTSLLIAERNYEQLRNRMRQVNTIGNQTFEKSREILIGEGHLEGVRL